MPRFLFIFIRDSMDLATKGIREKREREKEKEIEESDVRDCP